MRAIIAEDQPFTRHEYSIEEGLDALSRPALQSGDHQRGREGSDRRGPRRGRLDDVGLDVLELAGLHRPLSRSARPVDGASGAFLVDPRRRGLLARRREEPAAAAHLRHGLGERRGVGRAPGTGGPGRTARSPQARRRVGPLLLSRRDRSGTGGLSPQGRHHAPRDGGVLAPAPRGLGLRLRLLAAHLKVRTLRDLRSPRMVRRVDVPTDGARRRHQVLPEADELPVPHLDLQVEPAQLPRPAAALLRVRLGLSLREVWRGSRTDARARHDPRRRPYLLHQGADGRGADAHAAVRARPAARLRTQ